LIVRTIAFVKLKTPYTVHDCVAAFVRDVFVCVKCRCCPHFACWHFAASDILHMPFFAGGRQWSMVAYH